MKDSGYIKLYRVLLNSEVFQTEGLLKVWIWCLTRATYKERWISVPTGSGKTTIHLVPGQFIFGRETASKELVMAPSTVRNRMKKLADMGNVDSQSDSHYSIITILNWELYQGEDEEEGQPLGQAEDRQRTGRGHKQEG